MTNAITIGLDAKRIVRNGTGLGNYARSLVNDLARIDDLRLRLYAPDAGREALRSQVHEGGNIRFVYPDGAKGAIGKALWRSHGIVSQLQRDGVQVYHGLSGELPIGIRKAGIRSVVTIHDLIFLRCPEYYHWWDRRIYEWKFRQTLREADRIIAISQCTRRDIAELGGISEDRIDLIYQTCNPRFMACSTGGDNASWQQAGSNDASRQQASGGGDSIPMPGEAQKRLPQRFILSVGSIEERKNLLLAVQALPRLPEDIHLIAVGKRTPYAERVESEAERLRLTDRVHLLHGLSDANLEMLYRRAEVFVYPSRYEGFGIPIIEAIHCGLPVAACTGSCLEEAGGPDNLYVSPDDADALAAAVTCLLRGADGREQRIQRNREYVRRFQGSTVAAQVADIYRGVL